MRIGIPKERRPGETRVAATPETVKKLVKAGHEVLVEREAGVASDITDAAYEEAGAQIVDTAGAFGAELVAKVRGPMEEELPQLKAGSTLLGMLNPHHADGLARLAATGVTAFALEAAPRTTRAQSLDVLSSQANIAGYKAVLVAANLYQRFFPMMMTAAGTAKAARVVILGAGVAGLQAIATARRLGAVVEASDVRPAVKEQIESLGAKFIDVPYETDEEREAAAGVGGYARRQADVLSTTALIPGRKAPVLVTRAMVESMRPGSVVVDMAVEQGGNCELSKADNVVRHQGVSIAGVGNLPAMVPADASAFYARNILDFLKLIVDDEKKLKIDLEDDIVKACLVARDGQVLREQKA